MIFVEDKELVVPGEILSDEGFYPGRGTYKDGESVISSLLGLVSLRNKKVSVIPLNSKYIPKRGDVVIGEIDDIRFSMWGVNINSPYSGMLPSSEVFGREKKPLENYFKMGDVLFLRVVDVDEVKKVKLGLKGRGLGKFNGGIIVKITPTKVPRLIGKKGSMINMIKDKTNCDIVVGQNGVVWVKGEAEMELIAERVIKYIEENAHTSGLTDNIRNKLSLWVDGKPLEEFTEESTEFDESFKEDVEVSEHPQKTLPKYEDSEDETITLDFDDEDEIDEDDIIVKDSFKEVDELKEKEVPTDNNDEFDSYKIEDDTPKLENISSELTNQNDSNNNISNIEKESVLDNNAQDIEDKKSMDIRKESRFSNNSRSFNKKPFKVGKNRPIKKSKQSKEEEFKLGISKNEEQSSPTINVPKFSIKDKTSSNNFYFKKSTKDFKKNNSQNEDE